MATYTPSISESLIHVPKQIDLYGKTINFFYDIIFWAIEEISRGNDVTIVLALNQISALIDLNFGNALRCGYFGCLPSVMRSFTEIYFRNFEISWHFLKRVYRVSQKFVSLISCAITFDQNFIFT